MPDATDNWAATSELEAVLASVAYLLTRSQAHERQTARAGIKAARSDIYLLRALAEAEDASRVGDLAAWLMVEPSHVTRQIDRLQAQQLVERTPDALDRRARQVALTVEGQAVLNRLKQANIASLMNALDGIPEPDVATTVGVLRHLVERYARKVRDELHPEAAAADATPDT
ncbi:MarR family winged helix-turn-helix transcriptional regulator [Kitasatospora kifunensis]|uniref:DNA-binding MarR family transcriptional regulator n=1 Tax=Kitasatospora kifunensis TaxID=58351 RepID=A0A7W7QX08_KITKI|nr:MarR family transcriptional regulator [Kitasatospora kifunensis]MBB4921317.1 DNA-binding MarR family transcriptional regulator [Kitasatospora kifunensis]